MSVEWLIDKMQGWVKEPAMVWNKALYTYGDLVEEIAQLDALILKYGVCPGQVVAVEGDYSPRTCALLLSLIRIGAIVVPLTDTVRAHFKEFLGIAEAQWIITINSEDEITVTQINAVVSNRLTLQLIADKRSGLVLFSSGSTGKSKATLHDFAKILKKFMVSRRKMRVLNFLLLDHIGGINTLFYVLSNGGLIVTTAARSAETVCHLIQAYRIELLPTTPTFLNLLLISECYKDYDLSSLRLITYGTEAMPESTLEKLAGLFPNVQLQQTYGLTEIGILRSKSKSSNSLWVKVGGEGFETKVVDGILWIKAQSSMVGYLNRPNPFTEDGWFITGDAVEVEGDFIRILGRTTEIINVGGEKVYPTEVESVLQLMEGVEEVSVIGEKNPIMGQIVKAVFKLNSPESIQSLRKRMIQFCKPKLATFKIPQKISIIENSMYGERFKKMRKKANVNI
jgi:acyl-coenzyme A synthetase/AMP-(fatty) acid ligase